MKKIFLSIVMCCCIVLCFSEEIVGMASWYGIDFQGKPTASGELYNRFDWTCAHKTLEFGTRVLVTNLYNDKQIVVRVNDRGPFTKDRVIDVSEIAAEALDMTVGGVAKVSYSVVQKNTPLGIVEHPSAYVNSKNVTENVQNSSSSNVIITLQVGSFASKDYAERRFKELSLSGFKPILETYSSNSLTLYRVVLKNITDNNLQSTLSRLISLGIRDYIIHREEKK